MLAGLIIIACVIFPLLFVLKLGQTVSDWAERKCGLKQRDISEIEILRPTTWTKRQTPKARASRKRKRTSVAMRVDQTHEEIATVSSQATATAQLSSTKKRKKREYLNENCWPLWLLFVIGILWQSFGTAQLAEYETVGNRALISCILAAGFFSVCIFFFLLATNIKAKRISPFLENSVRAQIVGFVGLFMILLAVLTLVNGRFDSKPNHARPATIVHLSDSTRKTRFSGGERERRALVRPLNGDTNLISFKITERQFASYRIGEQLTIVSHPGFLGFEWGQRIE